MRGREDLFIGNGQKFKKFVTIIVSLVCVILTVITVIALIYSSDKRPLLIIAPIVFLFDIVNILMYKFYVTKLK